MGTLTLTDKVYGIGPEAYSRRGKGALFLGLACAGAAAIILGVVWPAALQPLLLSALAAGALVVAAKSLFRFLIFFITFLFFEGFLKNAYPYPVTFFLRDIFLFVIYAVWFVKYPLSRGVRGRYDKAISAVVGAFIFYTVILTLTPFTDETLLYRLGGARWWLANIPLFFVAADLIKRRRRFDVLCSLFLAVAFATAVYGIVQYFVGFEHLFAVSANYRWLAAFGRWYGLDAPVALRRRVFSTFAMPGDFAAAMSVASLLSVIYLINVRRLKWKLSLLVLLIVFFTALALTGCRRNYTPLLVAIAAFGIYERRRRQLVPVALALVVAAAAVLYFSRGVYGYRLALTFNDWHYTLSRVYSPWLDAVEKVRGHPFGLGVSAAAKVGRIFADAGWQSPFVLIENGFGHALVSLGWVGLLLFSALLIVFPWRLAHFARINATGDSRETMAFALCLSSLLTMLVSMSLYTGVGAVMYYVFAGAATSIYVKDRGADDETGLRMRRRP